jgi:transcriptional regulator with XRE-family HTH domain
MSEEDIPKLLRTTLYSEDAPELNDAVIDAFLSTPTQCPPETVNRVRTLFVTKLFETFHYEPVREIKEKWPFGRWVEAIRESFRLTREDLATTLHKEPSFLERFENGDSPPWSFSAKDVADLICLLRIHISAVHELVMNSLAVAQTRGVGPVSARSYSGKLSEVRGHAVKKALDLYLARNIKPSDMNDEVKSWMEDVRKNIQSRQATHRMQ